MSVLKSNLTTGKTPSFIDLFLVVTWFYTPIELIELVYLRLTFVITFHPFSQVHLLVSALAMGGSVPNMSLETGKPD